MPFGGPPLHPLDLWYVRWLAVRPPPPAPEAGSHARLREGTIPPDHRLGTVVDVRRETFGFIRPHRCIDVEVIRGASEDTASSSTTAPAKGPGPREAEPPDVADSTTPAAAGAEAGTGTEMAQNTSRPPVAGEKPKAEGVRCGLFRCAAAALRHPGGGRGGWKARTPSAAARLPLRSPTERGGGAPRDVFEWPYTVGGGVNPPHRTKRYAPNSVQRRQSP